MFKHIGAIVALILALVAMNAVLKDRPVFKADDSIVPPVSWIVPQPPVDDTVYPMTVSWTGGADAVVELQSTLRAALARKDGWRDRLNASYGVNRELLGKVLEHWATKYDFDAGLARLNALPHFHTQLRGLDVHFVHQRSAAANAMPILLLHGWPGTVVEFSGLIPLLTANDAPVPFHVVAPSLPGYGWSQAANIPGLDAVEAARLFTELMARLGYSQYYVHGGDWGGVIASRVAQLDPEHCVGVHVTFEPCAIPTYSALPWLAASYIPGVASLVFSQLEQQHLVPIDKWANMMLDATGYMHEQATRPDTLGFMLDESPFALLTWIVEKMDEWSVSPNSGLRVLTLDDALDNIMVYWSTKTAATSMRLYKETLNSKSMRPTTLASVSVPTMFAAFTGETPAAFSPKAWVQARFPNLVEYVIHDDRGGHWAAWEAPATIAADLGRLKALLDNRAPTAK